MEFTAVSFLDPVMIRDDVGFYPEFLAEVRPDPEEIEAGDVWRRGVLDQGIEIAVRSLISSCTRAEDLEARDAARAAAAPSP